MKVKKHNKGANVATLDNGELAYAPLDHLVNHPDIPNREIDKEHANKLADTIEARGLDVPLIVWNGGGVGGLEVKIGSSKEKVPARFVVAGAHRREGLHIVRKRNPERFKELFGENGVPIMLKKGTLKDVLLTQLRENIQRKDPEGHELFPFIKRLRKQEKMKKKMIAKAVGKSASWVTEILSIGETLGEEADKDLESGKISVREGRKAAKKVKKGEATKEEAVREAREKTSKLKSEGRQREEKRLSAKVLFSSYKSLPNIKLGAKLEILEHALAYLAGEKAKAPKELIPPKAKKSEKKEKKVKKDKKESAE